MQGSGKGKGYTFEMHARPALCFLFFLLLTPNVASTSVIYQFFGTTYTGLAESFQYTSPGYITTLASIPNSTLDSCTRCAATGSVIFQPHTFPVPGPFDSIVFSDQNTTGYSYEFPMGALDTTGTYTTAAGPDIGTLSVTSVPEPSMTLFVLSGLGLVLLRQPRSALGYRN
jgi:hypothetical protein